MRGYAKAGIPDQIRQAGGEIFAVSSEPQSLATEAEQGWDFGFTSTGDPHHEILDTCRKRGWLNLFVNEPTLLQKARSWAAHPKGYFQPGVLALTKEGRVLYRWRCRPTRANVGGAIERPTPDYVWSQIQNRLDGPIEDAPLDHTAEMDTNPAPWPLFVSLLLAHGWFIRPKVFPLPREDEPKWVGPQKMFPRLIGFIALWIAAFAFLPTLWVGLALAAWAAFVWPGIAEVNREFQNVPEGEPDSA